MYLSQNTTQNVPDFSNSIIAAQYFLCMGGEGWTYRRKGEKDVLQQKKQARTCETEWWKLFGDDYGLVIDYTQTGVTKVRTGRLGLKNI